MTKRIILVLAAVCLLVMPMVGCKKAKATPTAVAELPEVQPTATDTPVPPTATPVPPTATSTFTPVPKAVEPEAEEPVAPELVEPEDEESGTLFDLTWTWDGQLGNDESYILWVWPDNDKAAPRIYGFYKQSPVRITSANLPPGRYRWQVVVGKELKGQAPDTLSPYSEVRVFILVRPSLKANLSATPPAKPSATPTLTPTNTRTPWPTAVWTRVPTTPTVTPTVAPPTATPTEVYPGPTATVDGPTPTVTSVYPGLTPTPPAPTPTSGPYTPPDPTPTTEPYAPPPPTVEPTAEPTADPGATPEPTPEPTAYP